MTPLHKPVTRIITTANAGRSAQEWVVTMNPHNKAPFLTFRLPRHRISYTVPLAHCLDLAVKAAALELSRARRHERSVRAAATRAKFKAAREVVVKP